MYEKIRNIKDKIKDIERRIEEYETICFGTTNSTTREVYKEKISLELKLVNKLRSKLIDLELD